MIVNCSFVSSRDCGHYVHALFDDIFDEVFVGTQACAQSCLYS